MGKDELIKKLKKLWFEERGEVLEEAEIREILEKAETRAKVPIMHWSPNPMAVKHTLNFLSVRGRKLKEVREELRRRGDIEDEEEKYNFGVIPRDGNEFFKVEGDWGPEAKVSLTGIGKEFAKVLSDEEHLNPLEKTVMIGIQPYGSAFVYLSILEQNREEGILREDLKEKLEGIYGGSGRYYLGYYTSWFSRVGLIEKERVGKKVKYKPNFPSGW